MIDETIEGIVDKALLGKNLTDDQLMQLFDLETFSAEAAYAKWAGRHLARVGSAATAQVYAEIGVDSLPCPTDCGFCTLACSFGKRSFTPSINDLGTKRMITNPDGTHAMVDAAPAPADEEPDPLTPEELEARIMPAAEVARLARALDDAGVHLISLRCTDALDFARFLEMAKAARAAVRPDMPIMANRGRITADQAKQLADAGVQALYQSIRIGEGTITGTTAAEREESIRNARSADLEIMACVEPVHRGVLPADVLASIKQAIELKPFCSTVVPLTSVKGTRMNQYLPISAARAELYEAIARLIAGIHKVKFGFGGGNVRWVRTGSSTDGSSLSTDADFLTRQVKAARQELEGQEWSVPSRPLPQWFPTSDEIMRSIASAPQAYKPQVTRGPRTQGGPPPMPSGPRPIKR